MSKVTKKTTVYRTVDLPGYGKTYIEISGCVETSYEVWDVEVFIGEEREKQVDFDNLPCEKQDELTDELCIEAAAHWRDEADYRHDLMMGR